ncbi:hypothetical protein SCOCK_830011 [Actinacidiphila cocklensis]|uniref:Uncharacterized protein n=1 Tax=Actinacidiphila cocklensis TaxID=887465 RepID=A0A9W4GW16_9ACTN|nr:hypothetical protein SCOCK_830011 [Actinacidiphila cocklensis]
MLAVLSAGRRQRRIAAVRRPVRRRCGRRGRQEQRRHRRAAGAQRVLPHPQHRGLDLLRGALHRLPLPAGPPGPRHHGAARPDPAPARGRPRLERRQPGLLHHPRRRPAHPGRPVQVPQRRPQHVPAQLVHPERVREHRQRRRPRSAAPAVRGGRDAAGRHRDRGRLRPRHHRRDGGGHLGRRRAAQPAGDADRRFRDPPGVTLAHTVHPVAAGRAPGKPQVRPDRRPARGPQVPRSVAGGGHIGPDPLGSREFGQAGTGRRRGGVRLGVDGRAGAARQGAGEGAGRALRRR